jgi:hypothetical protein
MSKRIYNLDAIESIKIRDKRTSTNLEYKPFKKRFWGNRPEGFYAKHDLTTYTKEDLETGKYWGENLLVIDNIVYRRPYVEITFVSGQTYTKIFDTNKEALEYGNDISTKSITNPLEMEL